MIRRKNINPNQNHFSTLTPTQIKHSPKDTRSTNKYNYLTDQHHPHPSTTNSLPLQALHFHHQQQKQNQQIQIHKYQHTPPLLKKTGLYDNYNLDLKYLNANINKATPQTISIEQQKQKRQHHRQYHQKSITPLKEIQPDNYHSIMNMTNHQDDKTRRIESSIIDKKTNHFTRTSRYRIKEPKQITIPEDDLQNQYQQLWQQNQIEKFNHPFPPYHQQQFILPSSLHPQNQLTYHQPYIKPRHNPILTNSNRHSTILTKQHKNSVDHYSKSKKSSPGHHLRQNYDDFLKAGCRRRDSQKSMKDGQWLTQSKKQVQLDTDLKLKIVTDFSSKISLKIRELTASIEKMRHSSKR